MGRRISLLELTVTLAMAICSRNSRGSHRLAQEVKRLRSSSYKETFRALDGPFVCSLPTVWGMGVMNSAIGAVLSMRGALLVPTSTFPETKMGF
jgi:hypothetical protein